MKILKSWNQFNEAKIGVVKKSDLDNNWSAEYNLSDDIKDIKKNYKKYGRKHIIEKIIKLVNKIDEKQYNKFKVQAKKDFFVNLPSYKSASKISYWKSHWANVSTIIITLNAILNGIKKEKEFIKSEIENLKKELKNLDKIDEKNSWGFGNTVFNSYKKSEQDNYEYIGYNEKGHNGEEPIEKYDNVYEFGEEIDKKELENYISYETLINMFPVYNDVDFYNDWSVRCYKYEDYFLIQQNGWLYLFKKK